MRSDFAGGQLRKYVLGAATADERDAIERAYFERAEVLSGVSAAEDDLIDDYLSGRLESPEREQFESHYLSTPSHRRRVAVMRAIRNAASATRAGKRRHGGTHAWLTAGLAAASIILIAGVTWMVTVPRESTTTAGEAQTPSTTPATMQPLGGSDRRQPAESVGRATAAGSPDSTPNVVAVSISPILIRGADEPATLTIRTGADIVHLLLQGDMGTRGLGRGRAVVRTVAGREIWRGATENLGPDVARVTVAAGLLGPDDYIIELRGTDADGREEERHRYFLRVRAP
jgi:hypothetical protein